MAGASMDLDTLLGPVAEQPPCGPNLEYDAEFQAAEAAARGKDEQVIGDKGNEKRIPAVPPDWPDVLARAQQLFARTKDLRVAVLWTRAATVASGVAGLRDGLALIQRLLTTYWDDVHPQIDPADKDPGFRMNVLAGLLDPATTLREVRHAVIAQVPRKGRVTVLDVLVASGKLQPGGEPAKTLAEVQGLLKEAASEPANLEAVNQAYNLVADLQKLLTQKVGPERVPDLAPLRDLLAPAAELCQGTLAESAAAAAGSVPPTLQPDAMQPASAAVSATIRTREDAIRMLERVCDYMERNEPASPAPLLIRRAQRLMTKNFVEIIEDLTPDSLTVIKALGGIKD
jgi:type VI secretion system protein ImpA